MKIKIITLCILASFWSPVSAQDSLVVSFSEETDTLVKQRFIDRYENVFMTKVPTRHIIKANMVSSEMSGKGIYVGYEYKPLPFLSLEAGIFAQAGNFDPNRWDETVIFQLNNPSIWASGKLRWYYKMNHRIRSGVSANNFTGSYLGFSYDNPVVLDNSNPNAKETLKRLGLLLGYQGRFLQNGHFDFFVGLFNRQIGADFRFPGESQQLIRPADFGLGTQMSLGVALGDWKKRRKIDLCDVLVCDERIKSHWKFLFPDISVGLKYQRAMAAVMYERQIVRSPFSIQLQFESNFWRTSKYGPASRLTLTPGIQIRSYFLQKYQARRGLGGSSLSGLYAAFVGNYTKFTVNEVLSMRSDVGYPKKYRSKCEYLNTGVKIGYQQRLFSKLFVDLSYGYGWHFPVKRVTDVPYLTYPDPYDAFNVSMGIGLTL